MDYAQALAYLESLARFGFRPGLEVTRRVATLLGNPQDRIPCIHVAGTNGKGSVCALLESIHRTAGRRVGLYTSPHLVRFGERIQVDRVPIPDADLGRLTGTLRDAVDRAGLEAPPTFFEAATLLAFLWFAEQGCDLAVLETGLGGRLDATNIVTPLASVITNIGWDHMDVLGRTLPAIAAEKAGIIKPGVPVVTGATDPDARAILEYRARELDAPFLAVGPDAAERLPGLVGLAGPHQKSNAAVAAATVRMLRFLLPVSDAQLVEGLARVTWPGRMQRVEREGRVFVLDGAHNRDGAAAVRAALAEGYPGRRPTLILGVLGDKEWRLVASELVPVCGRILTVPVASPRTVDPETLRAACLAVGPARPVRVAGSLSEAVKLSAPDPLVLITGSLYLVGEALQALGISPGAVPADRVLNEWRIPGRL